MPQHEFTKKKKKYYAITAELTSLQSNCIEIYVKFKYFMYLTYCVQIHEQAQRIPTLAHIIQQKHYKNREEHTHYLPQTYLLYKYVKILQMVYKSVNFFQDSFVKTICSVADNVEPIAKGPHIASIFSLCKVIHIL